MGIELDDHGQPLSGFINRKQRIKRDMSELLGLLKGMLCDGVVTEEEAGYLKAWAENHPDALSEWPSNVIFARLWRHFGDGRVDEAERADLHELLAAVVGGTQALLLGFEGVTKLPIDNPPPLICYGPDEVFVFTGRFAYGPRAVCEQEVITRGARCESNVTRRTTFLVLGSFGSEDWAHTSYGRKIERAATLRATGFPIRIVGEDHWTGALSVV